MNQPIKTPLLVLFTFIHVFVFSQQSWTLDDCIAYALEHNLGQENQNYNTQIEKENWNQAKRDLIPQINIGLPNYTVRYGRNIDPITNTVVDTRYVSGINSSISTSIVLFESFKNSNTLAYQQILFETNKQAAEEHKYDLAFRIMNSFNDVHFNDGALSIVTEQQSINIVQQKLTASQVEVGMKAKADLYVREATVRSDELSV